MKVLVSRRRWHRRVIATFILAAWSGGIDPASAQIRVQSYCDRAFDDKNADRIQQATEAPRGSVRVAVTDRNGVVRSGLTGPNGEFCIDALPPGVYTVRLDDRPGELKTIVVTDTGIQVAGGAVSPATTTPAVAVVSTVAVNPNLPLGGKTDASISASTKPVSTKSVSPAKPTPSTKPDERAPTQPIEIVIPKAGNSGGVVRPAPRPVSTAAPVPSSTQAPVALPPTTPAPTTVPRTTLPPTTRAPSTLPSTTATPTTRAPSTLPSTTVPPTTVPPTTVPPTTVPPTTATPTTRAASSLPPTSALAATKPTRTPTTLATRNPRSPVITAPAPSPSPQPSSRRPSRPAASATPSTPTPLPKTGANDQVAGGVAFAFLAAGLAVVALERKRYRPRHTGPYLPRHGRHRD